jgi:Leucine-rich repeat (LRR) protein
MSAGGMSAGGMSAGGMSAGGMSDCGARIDDMEDGTGRICTGSGRVGVWYAFNDHQANSVQWPAETPPGVPIAMSFIPGSRGASTRGVHTYGTGFTYWGSGVGFDLNFDGTTYRSYDASRYQGVHFWARSSNHDLLRFRISSVSTTAVKYGGTCLSGLVNAPTECVGPAGVQLQLEPEWLEYTVSFAELGVTNERDRLTSIQFMTRGDFDFWIDDVAFLEGEPNCCSNLPTCEGGVRLSDAVLRRTLTGSDAPSAVLSCDLVCGIRSVNLSDAAIQSLGGFECLGALDALSLNGTQITDLAPLSGLTRLHDLNLTNGQLSNLGPLGSLRDLSQLTLAGNRISNVQPLAALTKLQRLSIPNNSLTDVAPLANLTALQLLDLSQNRIVNLGKPLQLPVLSELNLDDNLLTDVAVLTTLNALSLLHLNRNRVTDTSPLAALGQLTVLWLASNRITAPVGSLSGLTKLATLDLSHNQITTLGSLFGLPSLSVLDLGDNQLTEVSELGALTQLLNLSLSQNFIHTLSGSFSFSNMQSLDLSSNGLTDVPEMALSGSHLNAALLAHNQVQDLNAFSHVTFDLLPCGRCDPSAVLDLSDNPVRDLTPLLRSTWPLSGGPFAKLLLTGDPLDCTAQASNLQALSAQGVTAIGCP